MINSPLSFLREPDEGTVVSGRRLLALGSHQVDGRDDLRRLSDQGLVPLYADSAEFLAARGSLLDRFLGDFLVSRRGYAESKRKTLVNNQGQWEVDLSGQIFLQSLRIERALDGYWIRLHIGDWLGMRRTRVLQSMFEEQPAKELVFHARLDANAANVILTTPEGRELRCPNRHFLKLICSGPTEEFSLSKASTDGDSELTFRHSWLENSVITYEYGMLSRSGR